MSALTAPHLPRLNASGLLLLSFSALHCATSRPAQEVPQGSDRADNAPTSAGRRRVPTRTYEQRISAAKSYLESGRPEAALKIAINATEVAPDRADGWLLWGRALMHQKKLEESALKYEKARTLGSRERALFIELAIVYDVSKRHDDALAVYRDFLSDHPDDAELHQEMGLTLLALQRFEQAVNHLRQAVKLQPKNAQVVEDLGYALMLAGQLDASGKTLMGLLERLPERAQAMQTLARVKTRQGHYDEAIGLLDKAIALTRTDPAPVRLRAKVQTLAGHFPAAAKDYELLLRADAQDPGALVGYAGALIATGDLKAARAPLDAARSILGDHPVLAFRTAQLAWRQGDAGAVARIKAFADERPGSVEAWREVAAAAEKFGKTGLLRSARKKLSSLEVAPR